ncbi:S9 family peptidase [Brevundimonas sp.]|uniref:alpha/beta hydrolase family protein n=1 Tax=Brevundimonas sp. TaxID=1871086 RepID=UPI002737EDE9|nr:alpha/beta hydrolase [Brevundimonas sp.]MDP3802190.1 alpha/beta fold hydrolase [Brevundimonas sp.]
MRLAPGVMILTALLAMAGQSAARTPPQTPPPAPPPSLQAANSAPPADPAFACHVGLYRMEDRGLVDIAPVTGPGGRWRTLDGQTGRLTPLPDGGWKNTQGWSDRVQGSQVQLGACGDGRLTFDGREARRVEQTAVETTFAGAGGVLLKGRLILPPGDGPAPVMVEVHGSESSSARDFNWFQRLSPAAGVGVFVYDKRGTGGSEGRYTQDFNLLAGDAAAAVVEARRLAGSRAGRIGLHGGSQGGWVAPLAATLTPVDFVVVGFGMAEGVLAEDREEMRQDLEAKGWGPDVVATAREIHEVTAAFVRSNGAVGFAGLDAVRARYSSEPWWNDLSGDFSSVLLKSTNEQITAMKDELDIGILWDYDPMPVLRSADAPILWILAADDTEAPPEGTRERLTMLAAEGRPITLLQYPDADHGIIEFERGADGSRIETRYSEGYIQAVLDWAGHGELRHDLGRGTVLARPASTGARPAE